MIRVFFFSVLCTTCLLCSCIIYTTSYSPQRKYPKKELETDFTLMRQILEEKHPSLYLYTSKDSMDYFFDHYYKMIEDKMTEPTFSSRVVAPLLSKIRCGHTSLALSNRFYKWFENNPPPTFPLGLRIWKDTTMVLYNRNTLDTSYLRKGLIVQSINGKDSKEIVRDMLNCFSNDGYLNHTNYFSLSHGFAFYHYLLYGSRSIYEVTCSDSEGKVINFELPAFKLKKEKNKPRQDSSSTSNAKIKEEKSADFYIDSSKKFAVMTLDNFTKWNLRSFFRSSFKKLNENHISNLIIDLRKNPGGSASASTRLARYIAGAPFKAMDSTYSKVRSLSPYTKHFSLRCLNNLMLRLLTKKSNDGLYHHSSLQTKIHEPEKKYHFDGNVYILISGETNSASCLFLNILKNQKNVTLIGEETGGSSNTMNGVMIPEIILPNTHVRISLPLFRAVLSQHSENTGRGIMPNIFVPQDYEAIKKGIDKKMDVAKKMILMESP